MLMFAKMIDWWNDEEQTLLRHETARARRFFCSKTGIFLIFIQLIPIFQGERVSLLSYQGVSPRIVYQFLLAPLVENIIWLWLFYEYVLRRLTTSAREQILVTPLSPRMMWPALILIPLVWCVVAAVLELIGRSVIQSFNMNTMTIESEMLRFIAPWQHMLLLMLYTLVSAMFMSSTTDFIRLCGIVIGVHLAFIICLVPFELFFFTSVIPIFALVEWQSSYALMPDSVFSRMFEASMLMIPIALLLLLNTSLLIRLRQRKGLHSFALERDVSCRPASPYCSQRGS